MSASVNDKITDTRNAARPNSARVSSSRNAGGTTLVCDDLSGWPTASKVHFVTYRLDSSSNLVAGTQLDCTGIVSGNTITNLTVVDGNDNGSSVNDVVEMLPTAAWGQDLSDALNVSHERTGALKDDIVTTAKIASSAVTATEIASDAVTTAKILDSNVTTAKIADDAVTRAKLADTSQTYSGIGFYYDIGEMRIQHAQISWASNYGGNGWNNYNVTLPAAFADTNYIAIVNTSHGFNVEYNVNGSNAGVLSPGEGIKTTTQFTVRFYIGNSGQNGGGFSFIAIGKRP